MGSRFAGKVVVITGASSGVGRACARAFAAEGASLALIARSQEALENAAGEARALGGEALVIPLDVSDASDVERAAAQVEERYGKIDIWVNNAMVTMLSPISQMTADEFRRVTEVSYLGYVYGTLSALSRMRVRDEGTIIQIGSALAYRSIPLQSAYCAAKAAIRGFTDSLRTELIHDRSAVRVTHVLLPAVNTPQSERQRNKMPRKQQPVPPMYTPEAIADAILWAAEHAPREMLVGGPTVQAVLGQRLAPGPLDHFLASAAWEPQFVAEPNDQTQDILFDTLPGDPGAHGPYRERERGADLQMQLRMRPAATLASAAAMLIAGAIIAIARR